MLNVLLNNSGFKKKLYTYRPDRADLKVDTHRTKTQCRLEPCDTTSIERGIRQLLANKVSGTMVGIWLLVPEHLRMGTWDLLCGWTKKSTPQVEPRLALQLVHEAALCVTGVRQARSLSQKGFELANGLPFVATDKAIHELLDAHTVAEAQSVQIALGKIRRASGHYHAQVLAIDPHRIPSYSKRQMRRHQNNKGPKPSKMAQTFFCLDTSNKQPICFTTGTSSKTVSQATTELLDLASAILNPQQNKSLVVADGEHFTVEIITDIYNRSHFDLLVQLPNQPDLEKKLKKIPQAQFVPRWAGFATYKGPYHFRNDIQIPLYLIVQRCGETPDQYQFKAFLSTSNREEVDDLTIHFPSRWHVEEFFNANQALGWSRAGTTNINIRYGHMTLALIAQTSIHQLRQRLGEPIDQWDAKHLAKSLFNGLDGDIRVIDDTIVITYYNAPNVHLLKKHYESLPQKLISENVDPRIPWLCNFKLDFRFK